MLKKLLSGDTWYIQIRENRITAVEIDSGARFDEPPLVAIQTLSKGPKTIVEVGDAAKACSGPDVEIVNPFSHPRTLLADFTVAEKLLQSIFRKLHQSRIFQPSPRVVMHPLEKTDGGLTVVERRAFRELAAGAGAREVVVYEGAPLPLDNFDFEALKRQDQDLMGRV